MATKPVSPNAIDWGNSINNNLVSYVLTDNTPFIDKVTDLEVIAYTPSNLFGTAQSTPGGLAPVNDSISTTLGVDVKSDLATTGFAGITAISVISVTDLAQDCGLWSMAAGQNPGSWLDTSGGNLRVSAFTSYSTSNITATGIWVGGVRWNTDGTVDFINNGVVTDSSTQAFTPTATLAIMTSAYSATTKGFQADDDNAMLGHALWHRLLSNGEITTICDDFYSGLLADAGDGATIPIISHSRYNTGSGL